VSEATMFKTVETDQHKESQAAPDSPFQQHAIKRIPARDEIARRAYELYLARGAGDGRDVEDWIQAERELQDQGDYWMLL
jgi:hypothetical protein